MFLERHPFINSTSLAQCTNAIKNELNNIYCSTHLIKMGEKEAKRRKKPLEPTPSEGRGSSIASPLTQGRYCCECAFILTTA